MATNSPLLHDGSQCVAGADLSAKQFYAVKLTSARTVGLASSGGEGIAGILQNTPLQGDAADVGFFGFSQAIVGSAGATADGPLKTDTAGKLIDQGGTGVIVAYALDTGVENDIITVRLASPAG